jgi:cephalosporin hydroxylase
MKLFSTKSKAEKPRQEAIQTPFAARPMEESLDVPLRQILPVMQERIVSNTTYFGVPALKNPLDFWVYQELLYQLRPEVIVEVGNRYGGSTLALAHFCDLLGTGEIIGLDITHELVPEIVRQHPRITLIEGDACQSFDQVVTLIGERSNILVIEDSSHTYENTLNVLRTYNGLIQPGGYFIVEDSICYHGLDLGPRPGPYEAVETFAAENSNFAIDRSREDFLITWNPKGFLKRVA